MTTTYVAPSNTGRNFAITVTDAQTDAFGQQLSDLFDAGVSRYGSVDAFANALRWNAGIEKFGRVA